MSDNSVKNMRTAKNQNDSGTILESETNYYGYAKVPSAKIQYLVALISEFASHYGMTTKEAMRYINRYKAIDMYDRQYNYLHTQSFESNVRDIAAYCRRMGGTL